jgi:hypothetical protein
MTRHEALLFLQDFFENPYHLLPIIHESSGPIFINEFYDSLLSGQTVNPACAALILGISAVSAYFWSDHIKSHYNFASANEAARASIIWRRSSQNILDQSQHTYNCLEDIQARAILAYLVYNVEGCSAQFRFLHSCSVAVAHDGSLHLVDSPRTEQQDDAPTREIKRRLWWHLASSDW